MGTKLIKPVREYPPNCVNCNMPIKVADDLKLVNKQLYCKHCGFIRLKTKEGNRILTQKTNEKNRILTQETQKIIQKTGKIRVCDNCKNIINFSMSRCPHCKLYGNFTVMNNRQYEDLLNKRKKTRSRHISAQVKREVWRRDQGRCVECNSKELLEYDHIIPFIRGGSNTVRNIQLLCEKCNRKKHDKIE